jgi:thiol-disulfide isomerase/thioredoxin
MSRLILMGHAVLKLIRHFLCVSTLLMLTQTAFSEEHKLLLDGVDGHKHTLDEYIGHGKWVVVNIWATSCPYCRHELYDLANFHDAHHEKDAIVLGLTLDWPSFELPDKNYLAKFASDNLIDYPLLMVNGDMASKVLGKPVNMVPISFFYNPEGKLVYRLNGMVTEKVLEEVIRESNSSYRMEWADKVPPVYKPKK